MLAMGTDLGRTADGGDVFVAVGFLGSGGSSDCMLLRRPDPRLGSIFSPMFDSGLGAGGWSLSWSLSWSCMGSSSSLQAISHLSSD